MVAAVESMFSAREVPWHGIGTITDDVLTAEDAIIAAGLDWEVALHSLYAQIGKNKRKVTGRFAVVRDIDESILGLVGKKYVPFQNRQAFAFADSLVASDIAKYETAGSLDGGRTIFITMKVPVDMLVDGQDAHDLYLILWTSHDGKKAIGVCITTIRVVCKNTLNLAVAGAKQKWSMPHISTLEGKLQEARETIKLTFDYAEDFVVMGNQLVSTRITDDQLIQVLENTLPKRPKTAEVIETIEDLYKNSPTNGYTGTAWGGLNALTEYTDHYRDVRSQEAVFQNIINGEVATWRNKAAQQFLALR